MPEARGRRHFFVSVAQWIERLVAVQKVAGSIPAGNTAKKAFTSLFLYTIDKLINNVYNGNTKLNIGSYEKSD